MDRFAEILAHGFREKKRRLEITEILFELKNAYFKLFQEQSDELKTLADLYERFPRFLKVANAPELPTSEVHVLARLRRDARRRPRLPRWHLKEVHIPLGRNVTLQRTPCRFRYPHATLVPFE